MQLLTTLSKTLLFLIAVLAFRPALAQYGLAASTLTATGLALSLREQPATRLNGAPMPETGAPFYDDTHKDLGHSLVWMQETNATQPTYWNLYTEARIHLRMNNYPAALATAVRARTLAQNACNDTYTHLSEEVIKVVRPAPASPAATGPSTTR